MPTENGEIGNISKDLSKNKEKKCFIFLPKSDCKNLNSVCYFSSFMSQRKMSSIVDSVWKGDKEKGGKSF